MVKECTVLGSQIRLDQQRRIFVIAQLDAALASVTIHRRPVDRTDVGGQRRLVFEQCRRIGQAAHEREPERHIDKRQKPRTDNRTPPPTAGPHTAGEFNSSAALSCQGEAKVLGFGSFSHPHRV